MPNHSAEAFEDGIDLQIGLLEAVIPASRAVWPGYPFPHLQVTDVQEMRTFRTIVLENPFLRVTILPGMGGRIVSLFDKRTGIEVLQRHPFLEPQAGGRRGAFVREGIQLVLDGQERLNALGNTSSLVEPGADEDADACVWLSETFTGTGLSFHLKVSLPPDRAEVVLEAVVLNRSLKPQPYNAGLSLYLGEGSFDGQSFFSPLRNSGMTLVSNGHTFDGVVFADGRLTWTRFSSVRELAARQVDRWSVSLLPFSDLGGLTRASRFAAAYLSEEVLRVQVAEQRLGHKILLLTEDGQTLEAPVDLYPENVLEISVAGLNPSNVVLIDPSKAELLRLFVEVILDASGVSQSSLLSVFPDLETSEADLRRWTFEVGQRHLAYTLLGMKALAAKEYGRAVDEFEQALLFNAEDPLVWWGKALAMRLADQDNQAEVLNAHFLAPLEPALRAESFLSQPVTLDADANPLLNPLGDNPEEFIEVACLLIESGLFDQASRWIDEALRHRDLPMLRYLMAYCLLAATRLDMEAADQVRQASAALLQPPFPFRNIEIRAIQRLAERFPSDTRLRTLAGWVMGPTMPRL